MGYHRAGFDVTGVDIKPMCRYPFVFIEGDALDYLAEHGREYDVIHASPPCQAYSRMQRIVPREHPDLIPPTRALLREIGRPYIIENVEGSPLVNAVTLCGTMFQLRVRRHRLFEIHPLVLAMRSPCSCQDGVATGRLIGHRLRGPKPPGQRVPPVFTESEARSAIGVEWMSMSESREAIPPAYTEYVGRLVIDRILATA